MPGISGFIVATPLDDSRTILGEMMACMANESFYSQGSLLLNDIGVGINWVAHEGSFSDCNPVWNDQKDVGLIFAGSHFDDAGDCNARSLVHRYEHNESTFFESLNGAFSGLLIDRRYPKVVLFNDRFGLNRIYFHEWEDRFYFSSEAKSLLKILPHLRRLDMSSFGEFFSCGCPLQNRTLFSGVSLLPGGSKWTFAPKNGPKKEKYFDCTVWENQEPISSEEYYERLDATFTRLLPRYFRGSHRVALSLTGGLDSRMIIACTEQLPAEMPCYTFGGPIRDCADVRIARRIARACGRPHETIAVTPKFFSEFPELAKHAVYSTDGALDVMGSVESFVNRFARQIAPVRMTGNYGSEILRGNVSFKPMPISSAIFTPPFARQVEAAATTYKAERAGNTTSFVAFKQVPWHHHARWAVEHSQLEPRSPYLDNDLVALAYRAPLKLSLNKALAHRFIESHNSSLIGIPTDRGVVGARGATAGALAVLHQELFPRLEYLFDYGMPQWLAKLESLIAPLRVERLFLGRQKFYHFRVWYRDKLANYVRGMLLDPRTLSRAYLNGKIVEQIVSDHLNGRGNYTLEIHKMLTSELIQRELIEQN